jgi:Transmembrane secretion effector
VLREPAFRRFIIGYGLSYIFYWITLLAMGWWVWETTGSAAWVGFVTFCDLFPSLLVTPFAAALADRGDRFRILKTVLWLQVATGLTLAAVAYVGLLTPPVLAGFALVEGTLVGFSQPAFFGLINRLVSPVNLSAAVGVNVSVVQTSFILGPLLAGTLFSMGLQIAPLAFAANALGTLGYLWCLGGIALRPQPARTDTVAPALLGEVVAGITVFWTNPVAFRATVLILSVAILQRPLISLMPAINDQFALLAPAYFTILTASVMTGGGGGGVVSGGPQFGSGPGARDPLGHGGIGGALCADVLRGGRVFRRDSGGDVPAFRDGTGQQLHCGGQFDHPADPDARAYAEPCLGKQLHAGPRRRCLFGLVCRATGRQAGA